MQNKLSIVLISITLIFAIALMTIGIVAFSMNDTSLSYSPTVNRTDFNYSEDLTIEYNTAMDKLFQPFIDVVPSLEVLKDTIFKSFSNARVSEKTVQLFVDEAYAYDWEEGNSEMALFIKKFFHLAEDNSNTIVSVADENDMLRAIIATFMFLDKIDATIDEIGRFTYHFIYNYADDENRELMDKTGEENWTMLTVGTYTVANLTMTESNVYSSLSTARSVGQAITSLGYAYSEIIDDIGKENLSKLVGLDNLKNIDTSDLTSQRKEELLGYIETIENNFADVFSMTGEIFKAQEPLLYEELYLYEAKLDQGEDSDTHLVYAMYNLACGINKGIEKIKQNTELGSTENVIDFLSRYYAACSTYVDIIYDENLYDYIDYKNKATTELEKISDAVEVLNTQEFSSFYQVKKLERENPILFSNLKESATILLTTNYDYDTMLSKFVYSISIASIVSLL